MRGIAPNIERLGARLALVGSGTPQDAAWFAEDYGVTEPVLSDPQRLTYRALGARRGWLSSVHPRVPWHALRAWLAGFRQTETRGDAQQQGAVAIVLPGGEVAWLHRSAVAGDHPSARAVLEALGHAVANGAHAAPRDAPAGVNHDRA